MLRVHQRQPGFWVDQTLGCVFDLLTPPGVDAARLAEVRRFLDGDPGAARRRPGEPRRDRGPGVRRPDRRRAGLGGGRRHRGRRRAVRPAPGGLGRGGRRGAGRRRAAARGGPSGSSATCSPPRCRSSSPPARWGPRTSGGSSARSPSCRGRPRSCSTSATARASAPRPSSCWSAPAPASPPGRAAGAAVHLGRRAGRRAGRGRARRPPVLRGARPAHPAGHPRALPHAPDAGLPGAARLAGRRRRPHRARPAGRRRRRVLPAAGAGPAVLLRGQRARPAGRDRPRGRPPPAAGALVAAPPAAAAALRRLHGQRGHRLLQRGDAAAGRPVRRRARHAGGHLQLHAAARAPRGGRRAAGARHDRHRRARPGCSRPPSRWTARPPWRRPPSSRPRRARP